MPEALFDHVKRLAQIPHEPGCYLMKDHQDRIIYIGKAKDLKNRVRNYFQASGDSRRFVKKLPRLLSAIETIITSSEKEALILENTLIKRHKPKYNIALKDDKNHLSLRIDQNAKWPRLETVRRTSKDGATYFGPYSSSWSVRQTLGVVNRHFQLRTCSDSVLEHRTRPCLEYQIKRCPAPCVFDLDHDEYMQHVLDVVLFLNGGGRELIDTLQEKMLARSEAMEFEVAARYRDQIQSIRQVLERQEVVSAEEIDRDAFGFYREGERLVVQLMIVRGGKLEGARTFPFKEQAFPDEEILSSFLSQYYQSGSTIPDEVLLPTAIDEGELEVFEEMLSEAKGKKVHVLIPQRGAKFALVATAQTNAEHAFAEKHQKDTRTQEILEHLQQRFGLRRIPHRMECYDISNFQGAPIVGSMVVFLEGEAAKREYRQYKMKEVTSQDDFASMHELLTRRLQRVVHEEDTPPDLLIVDGGKGQLGQAVAVLKDLGLHEIDIISLAKSRVDAVGFQDESVTRSPERVFLPGRKNPIVLKQNSDELFLLQRIRDEAHRVAITFHKKLRRKQNLRSSLDDIPGVGPATKRALLKHFGSLKKIKSADSTTLQEVTMVGPNTAQAIVNYFSKP